MGLKENVILGHLVPTGTGFRNYQKTRVLKNVDLQAAAEEIGRLSKQGFLDEGGPVIRLEGIDDEPAMAGSGDGPVDTESGGGLLDGDSLAGDSPSDAGQGAD